MTVFAFQMFLLFSRRIPDTFLTNQTLSMVKIDYNIADLKFCFAFNTIKCGHQVTFALLWHFNPFWCKSHAIPRESLQGSWVFIPSPQDRNKY